MGKYTQLDVPFVEGRISEIVKQVTDEVVAKFQPRTVILKGSFARGEASVIIKDESLKFLSDCEIIIVPGKRIKRDEVQKLSVRLSQSTGLVVHIAPVEPELDFCLRFHLWNKIPPSIENYELKYGSANLYGENYLEKIPDFKPQDIPIWEGIRLIFNRMIESLNYLFIDEMYQNTRPSGLRIPLETSPQLLFQTYKTILACQDALLLSVKEYHHSYKVRNEIFRGVFQKYFGDLSGRLPKFLLLTMEATNYKLKPSGTYSTCGTELWFDVVEVCDNVLRYITEVDMGITFNSYLEFQEKYLAHPHIRRKYYRGLTPFPLYQNLRSITKMLVGTGKLPRPNSLTKFWTPWTHIIYSTIPLIYFGLSRDGGIDKVLLAKVRENISIIKKLEPVNPDVFREWEYIGQQVIDLRDTICY